MEGNLTTTRQLINKLIDALADGAFDSDALEVVVTDDNSGDNFPISYIDVSSSVLHIVVNLGEEEPKMDEAVHTG